LYKKAINFAKSKWTKYNFMKKIFMGVSIVLNLSIILVENYLMKNVKKKNKILDDKNHYLEKYYLVFAQ